MARSASHAIPSFGSRDEALPRVYVRVGNRRIPMPRRKAVRIAVGTFLTFFGIFPPAPLHALLPAGLLMLSVDFPRLRRLRRRMVVRIGRWRQPVPAAAGA